MEAMTAGHAPFEKQYHQRYCVVRVFSRNQVEAQ